MLRAGDGGMQAQKESRLSSSTRSDERQSRMQAREMGSSGEEAKGLQLVSKRSGSQTKASTHLL